MPRVSAAPDPLLALYDLALEGCERRDGDAVGRALIGLVESLDLAGQDRVAQGFYRVYDYCLRRALAGDFDHVSALLAQLREAWTQAADAGAAVPGRPQPMRSV